MVSKFYQMMMKGTAVAFQVAGIVRKKGGCKRAEEVMLRKM